MQVEQDKKEFEKLQEEGSDTLLQVEIGTNMFVQKTKKKLKTLKDSAADHIYSLILTSDDYYQVGRHKDFISWFEAGKEMWPNSEIESALIDKGIYGSLVKFLRRKAIINLINRG